MNVKEKVKNFKGITLIALVIAIIILIILAGVSIGAIFGDNGIITMAKRAKENVEQSQIDEQIELNELYTQMESEVGTSGGISYDIMAKFIKFKQIIAEAITNKGVETKETDSAETMAENIGKLESRQESEKTVIYYIDTDDIQMQKFIYGESVLNPSFTPAKEGYTFVGWREDNTAENSVLTEKTMQTEAISLYAVFKKEVTVTYDSNGGDTTPSTQVGYIYYNNGNIANPTFTLNEAITKTNYQFRAWALNSATSSTMFDASSTQIFSTDVTLYARWNIFTTKTGTYVGTINNWIGGSTVIQYGVTFVDKPTVTVSTSRSDLVPSASEINKSAFKLSWGSSSMSGGSGTLTWVARGYVYDGDSPDVVKSGTIAWQINNWVAGPAVTVSFGTTFKSPPTVMASCERADISVSVSNITTTSCVISYGSSSNSGGSGTIYWTATGEV